MCGLFGFVDTQHQLTQRQANRLANILGTASEARGTDASGLAWNYQGGLHIVKRAKRARQLRFTLPKDITAVMGHARMTTQGSEKDNRNNHPFEGTVGHTRFALAHNGVICNDSDLKKEHKLPQTAIQTDSYVVVQMLEQQRTLSLNSIAEVTEQLEGTLTLTILDAADNLYLVKGNNPLAIWCFGGLLCYASTEEILKEATGRCGFLSRPEGKVTLKAGDILKVGGNGAIERGSFDTTRLESSAYGRYGRFGWGNPWLYPKDGWFDEEVYPPLDELVTVAGSLGITEEDIYLLLDAGYCEEDIEALLEEPRVLREHLDAVVCCGF